jgi:hypothetical protein
MMSSLSGREEVSGDGRGIECACGSVVGVLSRP